MADSVKDLADDQWETVKPHDEDAWETVSGPAQQPSMLSEGMGYLKDQLTRRTLIGIPQKAWAEAGANGGNLLDKIAAAGSSMSGPALLNRFLSPKSEAAAKIDAENQQFQQEHPNYTKAADIEQLGEVAAGGAGLLAKGGKAIMGKIAPILEAQAEAKIPMQQANTASSKIKQAVSNFWENYMNPRSAEKAELLKGQNVRVNPDSIRGINPELEATADRWAQAPEGEVPASEADEVRSKLNDAARTQSGPGGAQSGRTPQQQKAWDAQTELQNTLNVDPRVKKLNSDLREGGNVAQNFSDKADPQMGDPVGVIQPKNKTDMDQLKFLSKEGGVDLVSHGKTIGLADALTPSNIVSKTLPKLLGGGLAVGVGSALAKKALEK